MGDVYDDGWVSAQSSGGAVAMWVMADLLAQMPKPPTVWLQTPTYGNYIPILTAALARFSHVPYYDPIKRKTTFDQMLVVRGAAKPGDVFRQDAVRIGLTRGQVADVLGVGMSTLNKWITAHKDTNMVSKEDLSLAHYCERLRRENRLLKEEREILKKAIQFFAGLKQ